jgi:hypothetical protein
MITMFPGRVEAETAVFLYICITAGYNPQVSAIK